MGRPSQLAALSLAVTLVTFAHAQPAATAPSLPNAPSAAIANQITGVVQDTHAGPVPGATVTLIPYGKAAERTATSAQDGTFSFTAVPPGNYRLNVAAQGIDLFASPEFIVRPGASVALPPIAVTFATSSADVNVSTAPEAIALAEIHEQETQRVLGVFQNFYTSYIWDAQPMPAKQKYRLAFHSLVDIPQFLIVAGVAGAEHFNGTYPGYGPGIEGYGKRYGAALADATTSRIIGSAILPSVLHQDPRYFYQGSGNVASRALHAAAFTFTARGDNGRTQPNYSHLLGSLGSAAISNLYRPPSSRGVTNTFQTFGINATANIIGNMFREFVLRHLESVPDYANGKH
jgi:hypothetical protein